MKILFSAYSCEPGKGSEPGIGWHWPLETARAGHETWVLTRASNRRRIEDELTGGGSLSNLHFVYYDLPKWARWWKKGTRGLLLYYLIWQWNAYQLAARVHSRERFDCVHHLTMGSIRLPCFMGRLGIPFVYGPVGGGEVAPWRLRTGYGIKGWLTDLLRDLSNFGVRFDPIMRSVFRQAERIYVTTGQGLRLIPSCHRHKASVQLAVGWEDNCATSAPRDLGSSPQIGSASRFLFVGRLLYWKGMHLGLRAFARFAEGRPDARLTIVGKGPHEKALRKIAQKLGIDDQVNWLPWLPRAEVLSLYGTHDALLFPSLHDSGGSVVFEAFAAGLPVICLDLGGPGTMVNDDCGCVVRTTGRNVEEVVEGLVAALQQIQGDARLRHRLSNGARQRLQAFRWSRHVHAVYPAQGNVLIAPTAVPTHSSLETSHGCNSG